MVLEELQQNDVFYLDDGAKFKKGMLKTDTTKDWANAVGEGHEYYVVCHLLNGDARLKAKYSVKANNAVWIGNITEVFKNPPIMDDEFDYHSNEVLTKYLGKTVKYINSVGQRREAKIYCDIRTNRCWINDGGFPNATDILINLSSAR